MTERHQTPSTASADTSAIDRDVIVVGGGQAGLAIGYFLAKQACDFAILEAANQPAAAWRARWDSLTLFTPVSGSPTKADASTLRLAFRLLLGDRPVQFASQAYGQVIAARLRRARRALSARRQGRHSPRQVIQ